MSKINKDSYQNWVLERIAVFFVYNVLMMLLVLMHSVGYFNPYFVISVNVIVMLAIVFAVILLRVTSKFVFACTIFFWLVASFFQLNHIDIWAERAGIYTYESLIVGVVVLFLEVIGNNIKNYSKRESN